MLSGEQLIYVVKLQNNSSFVYSEDIFSNFKNQFSANQTYNISRLEFNKKTEETEETEETYIVYIEEFDISTFVRELFFINDSTAPESKLFAALNEMPSHVSGHPIYILKNYIQQ